MIEPVPDLIGAKGLKASVTLRFSMRIEMVDQAYYLGFVRNNFQNIALIFFFL